MSKKSKKKKIEIKRPVGRPPIFTLQDFLNAEDNFFDYCEQNNYIPDVEGLAVYLDTSRETINEYEKNPEFADSIKRIKDKIAFYKKQLALQGKINAAIFCFDFKNNHNYRDQSQIEVSGEIKTSYTKEERAAEIEKIKIMLAKKKENEEK